MSHFSVLVHIPASEFNQNNITEIVRDKLQPFHEYECTGIKDQYVVEVDETDKMLEMYNRAVIDVIMYKNKICGSTHSSKCKNLLFNSASSGKELVLPDGYTLHKDFPYSEAYSLRTFIESRLCCKLDGICNDFRDGRFYRYTNPNCKWDWWEIGGRYNNRFLSKDGKRCNIIQVKDLDLDSPMKSVLETYTKFFDKYVNSGIDSIEYITWEKCLSLFYSDYELASEFYYGQEYRKKLNRLFCLTKEEMCYSNWLLNPATFYRVSREDYIKSFYYREIITDAILSNSVWESKEDTDYSDSLKLWGENYLDKIRKLDDNDYLVIVDCHI